VSCPLVTDAFLDARLGGAIEAPIHWSGESLTCDGMRRPDGEGLRVTFTGAINGERLTLVIGAAKLAEGASMREVPVNVTVIREGGPIYGTRGDDKCLLDDVHQTLIDDREPGAEIPASQPRHWRIDASGFCLEPARSITDPRDAILLGTFDFRGQITWEPDVPADSQPGSATTSDANPR
jgi:hypothetical protein